MVLMKIPDCPAVGNIMTLKSPFFSQRLLNQCWTSAAWFSVRAVVCSHNSLYIRFFDKCLKSRKIRFFHIFRCRLRIKFVAQIFRTAVYRKMFCTGCRLHHLTIALQTFYKRNTQTGSQIRILSRRFMTSSPAWIAENIYIW